MSTRRCLLREIARRNEVIVQVFQATLRRAIMGSTRPNLK
jgi:hypothetical protein